MSDRRALIVSHPVPAADRDGSAGHALFQARTLLEEGWSVTVVAEDARPSDAGRIHVLQQLGVEVFAGRESRGIRAQRVVDQHVLLGASGFTLAIVHFWGLADRWLPWLRDQALETRIGVLVDSVDVHLLRLIRGRLNGLDGGGRVLDGELMVPVAMELNAYAAADAVLTVSAEEAGLIDLLLARPGLGRHVPLSREVRDDVPGFAERRGTLFVGNYDHVPNAQAVDHVLDDVLPRLDAEQPAAHPLRLVGSGLSAEQAARWSRVPGAVPIGWVPSLEPELRRARAFVGPLPNGAGVKNKVLDAMAAGLPVVTNAIGAEGLDVRDGRDLVLAEAPEDLAAATGRLLTDAAHWQAISEGGRAWIAAHARPADRRAALLAAVDQALRA